MLACLGVALQAVPPARSARLGWIALAVAMVVVASVRCLTDAKTGLDLAVTALLIGVVLTVGREVLIRRAWPAGSFVVAIAVVTAVGIYGRSHRLAEIAETADRPLQPDVVYYQQQALATANPFAAGYKSPLWPALHSPLVRLMVDRDLAMRLLSWAFGILMLPAVAVGMGRLFEPLVGVIVAGLLAADTFLIDLCTQGLREELGICLWMAVLVLLFEQRQFTWKRTLAAGMTAGILLLLRNTDLPVLMVLLGYALIRARTPLPRILAGLALPLAIVAPFYVNQYRAYGDPFYLEKRDARYHANLEFRSRGAPPGLTMPTEAEYARDLYAGEPLSPAAYLFAYHDAREIVANQWNGLRRVLLGDPFAADFSLWLRLACAAGVVATLLRPGQRFAGLFVAGSVLGIRAHLMAIGHFEQRLLLPVMVIWLAAGWWLITAGVRAGLGRWVVYTQHVGRDEGRGTRDEGRGIRG